MCLKFTDNPGQCKSRSATGFKDELCFFCFFLCLAKIFFEGGGGKGLGVVSLDVLHEQGKGRDELGVAEPASILRPIH